MAQRRFLFLLILGCSLNANAQNNALPAADSVRFPKRIALVPQNFYTSRLGFFCKQELQVQKRTGVNVFFRLGSKAYVDYLEQKPGARKY